ncbi:MAG TPA: phosphodiester glycosidase family protein [Anaerolineales bacterium]|nr:phosphodiester glycosidase family protein [Anaerolineales bacterium]
MPRNLTRIFLLTFLFFGGLDLTPQLAQAQRVEVWTSVAKGIAYREFYLDHPNRIYVARMDRNEAGATLDTGIGMGDFSSGLQTVRGIASLYDQTIGYWDRQWGTLNHVVVAINGFFYDTETGIPWSGQVASGWYAKRFDERQSGSSLVWTFDRNIFVGDCVVHPPNRQLVHFPTVGVSLRFDSINLPGEDDELIIFTPHYGDATPPGEDKLDVLVQLERPLMIMPDPAVVKGVVVGMHAGQQGVLIPFDHIVLRASGKQREQLEQSVNVGDEVEISQELKHYLPDCKTSNPINWENIYAATGASFVFLKEGKVQALNRDLGAVLRSPRTAIAYNDRYIFFMVVDGRDRFRSLGMSMVELSTFAKMTLGANWGVAMDGGGSSTMVVNGRVVNHPLTDVEEVTSREFPGTGSTNFTVSLNQSVDLTHSLFNSGSPAFTSNANQVQEAERAVANSWMMISTQPAEWSNRYQNGQEIFVSDSQGLTIRSGPGDHYSQISVVPSQSGGLVLAHPLNGVFSRGFYWWKVEFGGVQGWAIENGFASR